MRQTMLIQAASSGAHAIFMSVCTALTPCTACRLVVQLPVATLVGGGLDKQVQLALKVCFLTLTTAGALGDVLTYAGTLGFDIKVVEEQASHNMQDCTPMHNGHSYPIC